MDLAEKEILLESYIFALDLIGEQFIAVLNKKAEQGLEIKIHLDAVGSHYYRNGQALKKKLHNNISLRWFHRWSWYRLWRFNVRNHRKLLVIDRKLIFMGGFNIHQQCSRQYYGIIRWRDTHMILKTEEAELVGKYFDDLWLRRPQRYYESTKNISFIPNLSRKCRFLLRCQLSQFITSAKVSIQLTTPYFVPDEYLIKDLIRASQRGIKVSLLVPDKGDHPLINTMAWHYYTRLTHSGIKVYAYLPRMLHAKTMVVDSSIVMIGSANMDYRSLFINHELVCLFVSKKIAEDLNILFKHDCEQSRVVTPLTKHTVQYWWLRRPIAALLKHLI
tara:strand:+ start:1783 stop:2778 length:996 start_codon:yes stop_codon:yes gene_type:complete